MLRVVSNEELDRAEAEKSAIDAPSEQDYSQLAGYIRTQFEVMKRHRSSHAGWNERLLAAQRMFNGEYSPQQLQEIKQFAGSEVYARIIAVKCRGASALLRDVYLGTERSWGVEPTPDPTLPDDVIGAITQLVQVEVQTLRQAGQEISPDMVRDRTAMLMDAATRAAKKKARLEAGKAEDMLDDLLVEGGFYKALSEFLTDLPLFPFACMKGPVVRIVPDVQWEQGRAVVKNRAKMFWQRVSPFDIFFSPGATEAEDADFIERVQFTRGDLNEIMDLPGYFTEEIEKVLDEHGRGGLYDFLDPTDSERATNESRENPHFNQSNIIHGVEYHGSVQGRMLLELGFPEEQIPNELRDYHIQAWMIGRHVIKCQLTPSPRKRNPYYMSSFEKVPGTMIGNGLPDILSDIQDVCNATLRALVNNLAISSGPQVVVDVERLAEGEDPQSLYPWKRWMVANDPLSGNQANQMPVYFFQPNSNAQELLGVYEKFTQMADELSAIPRYVTGSDRMGGAGRTASGLAMLMGNASKILQTVAANIDRDVMEPLLHALYDMIMLTDETGRLRGDETIRVRGVNVAVQRETDRMRQIEFLQMTANPIDSALMGPMGRASVLRSVADGVGLDGEQIVPPEDELQAQMQAAQMQGPPPGAGGPGGPPGASGQQPPGPQNNGAGVQEARSMRGMA
jgi:hypothetical protein